MLACSYGWLKIVHYLLENEFLPFRNILATNKVKFTSFIILFIDIYVVIYLFIEWFKCFDVSMLFWSYDNS